MNNSVLAITPVGLLLAFLPVGVVMAILFRWSLGPGKVAYAVARMLLQLVLIGYVLNFLFTARHGAIVIGVLAIMLVASSWIAMRPLESTDPQVYLRALFAIGVAGLPILTLVTQGVIGVDPWYSPQYVIPLGGMIFAGAMNSVSLAAERQAAELALGRDTRQARIAGLRAALIPLVNSLLAVGLVSLPGMMTGQILSGVEPLVAARYQIVVMCMLFGSGGIASACYLWLAGRRFAAHEASTRREQETSR